MLKKSPSLYFYFIDPFMGRGTTAVSALKSDRKFVGYDTDEKYIRLAETRLSRYRSRIKFGR